IWDAHTGQMVGEPLEGHTGEVHSVAYSPDSTHIVSGSDDNTIRIWDARTSQMVGEPLEGHTDWVYSVAYSPDSTRIVSGSWDNTIQIWHAHTGQMVNRTRNNSSALMPLAQQTLHQGQLASDVPISNPASSSYPTANSYTNWTLNEDGWVLADRSKLLMWVPPDMRSSLLHPRILAIISKSGSLALDFSNAHLGENW
ncbi:WD40 repeat-like protein, partial [Ceratobasidium sp. AG-I]